MYARIIAEVELTDYPLLFNSICLCKYLKIPLRMLTGRTLVWGLCAFMDEAAVPALPLYR